MYCLITTWHLIIVRMVSLNLSRVHSSYLYFYSYGFSSTTQVFRSDHTKQDLMVRITADQNLSTSRHSLMSKCLFLILENKKESWGSAPDMRPILRKSYKMRVKAHGVQGPSPLSTFSRCFLPTPFTSNSRTHCVSHKHHSLATKSCDPEDSCSTSSIWWKDGQ